ncbi:hypothetical protein CPB86DRAFT_178785 [Serendipita vermifera]|nr:hypothetical protein CPB86DRAFT_178785 [Serendipita vermifera]
MPMSRKWNMFMEPPGTRLDQLGPIAKLDRHSIDRIMALGIRNSCGCMVWVFDPRHFARSRILSSSPTRVPNLFLFIRRLSPSHQDPYIEPFSLISIYPFKFESKGFLIQNLGQHEERRAIALEKARRSTSACLTNLPSLKFLPNFTHLYLFPLKNHGRNHHLEVPQLWHGPLVRQVVRPKTAGWPRLFPALLCTAANQCFATLWISQAAHTSNGMLVGLVLARIPSEAVKVAIGKEEAQVEPSGITPGDVESRFR